MPLYIQRIHKYEIRIFKYVYKIIILHYIILNQIILLSCNTYTYIYIFYYIHFYILLN